MEEQTKEDDEYKKLGVFQLTQKLLSGQFTYLTYMVMSTTCFFTWMTPNYHRIKSLMKPMMVDNGKNAKNEQPKRAILTRSKAAESFSQKRRRV